jgi:hypothetical protein
MRFARPCPSVVMRDRRAGLGRSDHNRRRGATQTRKKAGDKPHLCYNFSTIRTVGNTLTVHLAIPDSNQLDARDETFASGAS